MVRNAARDAWLTLERVMDPANFVFGSEPRRKIIVFSHERSGTHFLMNTLAANFGYVSAPWWNLDYETGLNFHAPALIFHYLDRAWGRPVLNIVKSHHALPFIEPVLPQLAEEFAIFYIYRDPRDVMRSYWQWLQQLQWDEGPKAVSLSDFIRAAPRGGMLRYQKEQQPNMLHRWAAHVDPWRTLAEGTDQKMVLALRYEDLDRCFPDTLERISLFLGEPLKKIARPDHQATTVGNAFPERDTILYSPVDHQFFLSQIGKSMQDAGYSI